MLNSPSVASKHPASVVLGETHGYRILGDQVELSAQVRMSSGSLERALTLELWAFEGHPIRQSLDDLQRTGTRLASLPMHLPTAIYGYEQAVRGLVPLTLPTSNVDHTLLLAIVEEGRSLRDSALYPRPQRFVVPRLTGNVGYRIDGNSITLSAARVENQRPHGDLSGSLALELWAFSVDAPDAQGRRWASVPVSPLSGQHFYADLELTTEFKPPPPGRWNVALLLREWGAAGEFITRDRRPFEVPYEAAPTGPQKAQPPTRAKGTGPRKIHETKTPHVEAAPKQGQSTARSAQLVSIHRASAAQLSKVSGLNPKLAGAIVKGRPYKSLDELAKIRGIGDNLLQRLRSHIQL